MGPGAAWLALLAGAWLPGGLGISPRQARSSVAGSREEVPSGELGAALPIAWVCVPKSCGSFLNTLLHLPGVCRGLPEDAMVSSKALLKGDMLAPERTFKRRYGIDPECPGLARRPWTPTGLGGQVGAGENLKGDGMIMLRNPEFRLISAYRDLKETFDAGRLDLVPLPETTWGGWPNLTLPSLEEFMLWGRGCATRMLTRPGHPCGGSGGPPNRLELDYAKQRLSSDFSFVGLYDDWPASMCLFKAMFQVPCKHYQFMDAKQEFLDERDDILTAKHNLKSDMDPYDGELYEEAVRLFNANIERFNVTENYCIQTCFEPAGLQFQESLAAFRLHPRVWATS